jgi:hypothetical protein
MVTKGLAMPRDDARTAAAGPEPALLLACRFWALVRADLAAGDRETAAWLDSADFRWWAGATLEWLDPEQVRRRLLAGMRPPAA